MSEDRWSRVEQIYHAALEHTPEQRPGFIAESCASDSSLRSEVESLLAYHGRGDALLEAKGMQGVIHAMAPISAEPGASLGPYQILARAGKGGDGRGVQSARCTSQQSGRHQSAVVRIRHPPGASITYGTRSQGHRQSQSPAHLCPLRHRGTERSRISGDGDPRRRNARRPAQTWSAAAARGLAGGNANSRSAEPCSPARDCSPRFKASEHNADRERRKTPGLRGGEDAASGFPANRRGLSISAGAIIGTLQYMPPEQLEGKAADERADIYAFGVVLYEMLTGKRAFEGENQAALISAIMTKQPPALRMVNPCVPGALEHVVENCLAKDVEARWQTAADVLLELKWLSGGEMYPAAPGPKARRSHRVVLICAAAAVVLAGALSFLGIRLGATKFWKEEGHPVRLEIPLPDEVAMGQLDSVAISPDGRKLVFTCQNTGGRNLLWVRDLDSLEPRPLPDVEGEIPLLGSGQSIDRLLFRGSKAPESGRRGWNSGNALRCRQREHGIVQRPRRHLFAGGRVGGELRSVPETGGQTKVVLRPDKSKGERSFNCPSFLPDGRHFLYFSRNIDRSKTGIYVSTLESGKPAFVMPLASCAMYAPPGHILFIRDDALIAQQFDAGTLHLRGDPFTLAQDFGSWDAQNRRFFSVSQHGVLAYRGNDAPQTQLIWYTRDGKRLETAGENGRYLQIALSPDGTKVTLEKLDTTSNTSHLWLLDIRAGVSSRLTSDPGMDTDVIWSPDSREIVLGSDRIGQMDLFRRQIGASQDSLLYADGEKKVPESWTTTGDILYMTGLRDMHLLKAHNSGKPVPLLQTGFQSDEPHVSPDGRWVAYGSVESGRWDIYVASFPDLQNKLQLSNGGGAQPLWRSDGKELYYLTLDGKMMAIKIVAGATLKAGVPRFLFETRLRHPKPVMDQYGVTPDGQRFLVAEPLERVAKPITVVLNWPSAMHSESSR